jgi:hypothetical protein
MKTSIALIANIQRILTDFKKLALKIYYLMAEEIPPLPLFFERGTLVI